MKRKSGSSQNSSLGDVADPLAAEMGPYAHRLAQFREYCTIAVTIALIGLV